MKYTPKANESLLDIATRLTLSPAYAEAIGNHNGIYADVDSAGSPLPYSITSPIAGFGVLDIPDSWLKPGASAAASTSNVLPWIIGGFALLLIAKR